MSLAGAATAQGTVKALPAKQPRDGLGGAPFVTATAWAIGDPKTGAVLHGFHETERRPIASTTKIMTALLVMRLAARDPKVWQERVRVSAFASNTVGSSARLNAGDSLTVRDLLYGLLLPSGNDAANAIAEHFGPRFEPPKDPKAIPWSSRSSGRSVQWMNFVAEMNREAKRLGMTRSRFVNPHGLDARLHYSCAHDLLLLARAAMGFSRFAETVKTRSYVGTLETRGRAPRRQVWRNTNRLLGIRGYDGVKTGTTSRAGSCLVSRGSHGDQSLLVVVLNSANRNARYVDTRNLFRFGFKQRAAGGK